MSDAQWQVFAQGANRIAEAVRRETGLRTVFHHHPGWVVVEQDVLPGMGSPLASAQRNRTYLRQIGL